MSSISSAALAVQHHLGFSQHAVDILNAVGWWVLGIEVVVVALALLSATAPGRGLPRFVGPFIFACMAFAVLWIAVDHT